MLEKKYFCIIYQKALIQHFFDYAIIIMIYLPSTNSNGYCVTENGIQFNADFKYFELKIYINNHQNCFEKDKKRLKIPTIHNMNL